jgi:hypothetical protein
VSPTKPPSSSSDDRLYVRPVSIRILVAASVAIASLVGVIGLYLGNERLIAAEHLTPLRVWTLRALVLLAALVGGWQVRRRSRRR